METKHYIAIVVLIALGCGTILVTTFSQKLRDYIFFVMSWGAVLGETGPFDVNFLGQYWYRGTSRGISISVIDVLAFGILVGTLFAPRYPRRPWFIPAGVLVYLLYFGYCIVSMVQAQEPMFAVWELVNIPRALIIMLATAAFVRTRRELGILVVALGCAVCVQLVYAMKQRFVAGMFRPCGTLDHANSLSMYLCLVTPVLLAAALSNFHKYIRWFATFCAALGAFGVVLTLSRMGIPTFVLVSLGVCVCCTTWRITRRKVIAVAVTLALGTFVVAKSWDQMSERFGSASLKEEYIDIEGENRGVYWRWAGMIMDEHPFGVGLNNWSYMVSKTYGPRIGFFYEDYDDIKVTPEKADLPSIHYAPPAHTLVGLTLGELGVPGMIIFGLVWMRWFSVGVTFLWRRLERDPMHRLGIGILFATTGIFLQSITEWTYRQPAMFLTFHMMLGALASLAYAKKHAKSRGEDEQPLDEIEIEATPVGAGAHTMR